MTLEILKSEALKLKKSELFDFTKFLLDVLQKADTTKQFELSKTQKKELAKRLEAIQKNPMLLLNGQASEAELIAKYEIEV